MLRTLVLALAVALPAAAEAQPAQRPFPQSAIGVEVRGAHGVVLGEIAAVERNADGEIVAAEIPGLEPEDAPRAPMVVADMSRAQPRTGRERNAHAAPPAIIRVAATTTAATRAR